MRGPSEAKSRGGVINHVKKERYQERLNHQSSFEYRPSNLRDEKFSVEKCNAFGHETHKDARKCPTNGKEYFNCKRIKHFSNVCRSEVKGYENKSIRSKEKFRVD